MAEGGGIDTKITIAELPPPPPPFVAMPTLCLQLKPGNSSVKALSGASIRGVQATRHRPLGWPGSRLHAKSPLDSSNRDRPFGGIACGSCGWPSRLALAVHSRRRHPLQYGTPRGGNCWFLKQFERQWVTLRTHAQVAIPPLVALESPGTWDAMPTELSQSQEERRPEKFIPNWVALLFASEVGQNMGAERGGVSGLQ